MVGKVGTMSPSQAIRGHAAFLKRNGGMLADLLEVALPPLVRPGRNFLTELTILAATYQVSPLIHRKTRTVLVRLTRKYLPHERARWSRRDWAVALQGLPGVRRGAGSRLARMHKILSRRHDFPTLTSMKVWGVPKWRAFFAELGWDTNLAYAVTALLLDREQMPGGPNVLHLYRRLGFRLDPHGNAAEHSLLPRDLERAKWRLQQLAVVRCTPRLRPGPRTCGDCPLKRMCLAHREATAQDRNNRPGYVDIFAGGGGLSLGLTRAGLGLKLAIEKERHAADTLYLNHPEAPNRVVDARDIRRILSDKKALLPLKGTPVVAGGPPCQPFSMARRHSKADQNDPRRFLFRAFVRAVAIIEPKIVIMENVPGIQNAAGGKFNERIVQAFVRIGYHMDAVLLNAADYGVAQNRHRVFFIGVRKAAFRSPERMLERIFNRIRRARSRQIWRAGDALHGLPRFRAGEGGNVVLTDSVGRISRYAERLADEKSGLVFNHETRPHNPHDIKIYRMLRHGETAASLEERHPGIIPYQVESFGDKYRKIHPERPAPTIPAHLHRDSNSFVHFDLPRGITPREAARFQSFPDSYVFLGGFGPAFIQIGNAVPPKLGEVVGRAVLDALGQPRRLARHAGPRARPTHQPHAPTAQ